MNWFGYETFQFATESTHDAKSRIEDADIAFETSDLVRNQILQQAQVAVAARVNLQLSVVLGLLKDL